MSIALCATKGAIAQDQTPPEITPTVTGTLGNNGWYTSNVKITWQVTDPDSAIQSKSGCKPVTLRQDTSGKVYTCIARSQGGTTKKKLRIKRDTSPPKVTIATPVRGKIYKANAKVKALYKCSDPISKVSSCTGTVANHTAIPFLMPGINSFAVEAVDRAGNSSKRSRNYKIAGVPSSSKVKGTHLFAWNDLGMHCTDSDFSVFTLLPPFNDLTAQLVVNGKLINTTNSDQYQLTYTSIADSTGSINTTSQGKTNFWDYDVPLFSADLPTDVGLTGNPTPSLTPAPVEWNSIYKWYEATGIPIVPIDDRGKDNYFPMVRVTAVDGNGKTVAANNAVLPVSSEINCMACHASSTGSYEAQPAGGWVNLTPGSEQDWRLNILRLHDEKNSGSDYSALLTEKGYAPSLESSAADNGVPILCDTCHNSNALAVWGITGKAGVSNMTAAMHTRHANVTLPGSNQTLESITTRDSCYNCHPGQKTQCLRGAMGNPVDAGGQHIMECQSCHGSMLTVGNNARQGWYDMPTCQSCHHDGERETVAINGDGTFKTFGDTRFASNPNTPEPGISLYRFSTGHGDLQCAACHNSPHAEFTNKAGVGGNQYNDNLQAISAQGYAAAIRECTVCHTSMPNTRNGGPHGMHSIGQSWVSEHEDAVEDNSSSSCFYCHGSTRNGSDLAVIKKKRTFTIEDGRRKTFAANEKVTCWSCHNGPHS